MCAAAATLSCSRDIAPGQQICASFSIEAPLSKTLADGASATELTVSVFDANHDFLYSRSASRTASGWDVELMLVPGVYSFSFWACSPEADAFAIDGEYMAVSYPLMDLSCDAEDAFWAAVPDMEATTSFQRTINLRRPFAMLEIVTDAFAQEETAGASASITLSGQIPSRLNLLSGEVDLQLGEVAFTPAPLPSETRDGHAIAASAYVLAPDLNAILCDLSYSVTLSDGRTSAGTVENVPLQRNHLTTLLDY